MIYSKKNLDELIDLCENETHANSIIHHKYDLNKNNLANFVGSLITQIERWDLVTSEIIFNFVIKDFLLKDFLLKDFLLKDFLLKDLQLSSHIEKRYEGLFLWGMKLTFVKDIPINKVLAFDDNHQNIDSRHIALGIFDFSGFEKINNLKAFW